MKSSGVRWWWWGCNFDGQQSLDDDSGNGIDLDDCKAKFLIAWTRIRAGLTDIAKAQEMRRRWKWLPISQKYRKARMITQATIARRMLRLLRSASRSR